MRSTEASVCGRMSGPMCSAGAMASRSREPAKEMSASVCSDHLMAKDSAAPVMWTASELLGLQTVPESTDLERGWARRMARRMVDWMGPARGHPSDQALGSTSGSATVRSWMGPARGHPSD